MHPTSATATDRERALRPGVWKFRRPLFDRNAYYAVTETLSVLGNCLYIVSDDEADVQLVSRLRLALVEANRPQLQLVARGERGHSAIAELEQRNSVIPFPAIDELDPLAAATQLTPDAYAAYLHRRIYGHARAG